jgi:phosphatidate phosphatase PAH1
MNLWNDKGYIIVYLTARPHAFRAETRSWLSDHEFPPGPVITANSLVFDDSARNYKRTWVNRLTSDFGWTVTAAYGNATSDIDAYEEAAIPKNITFIVGEHAGVADTQAILDNDYTAHIADFVEGQPDA